MLSSFEAEALPECGFPVCVFHGAVGVLRVLEEGACAWSVGTVASCFAWHAEALVVSSVRFLVHHREVEALFPVGALRALERAAPSWTGTPCAASPSRACCS